MISKFLDRLPNSLTTVYLILMVALIGCTSQAVDVLRVSATLYPTGTDNAAAIVTNATVTSLVQNTKSDLSSTAAVVQNNRNPTNIPTIAIKPATNIPTHAATAIVMSYPTYTVTPNVVPITATPTSTLVPTHWPTPDALVDDRVARVPILMYHYIEPLADDADNIRVGLTVQPGVFRQQLAYLHAQGYRSISLYDLTYYLTQGRPLPDKPIIFCFDDGYRGLYQYALPHMQAFGYTGTVFVLTQLMDEQHPSYLTWEMAHKMYEYGWKIEPHSKTHVQLSDRSFELVQYQVLGSMQTLQAHIGRQPRYFSYPSGFYDQQVIDYLKELGFWGALTTEHGLEHDFPSAFTWKRIRVSGKATIDILAKYLDE